MDSSFTPIEQMLKFRASRQKTFPFQEILLTRLCMHMQGKLLENRNKMLKAQGINETLFMALITLSNASVMLSMAPRPRRVPTR